MNQVQYTKNVGGKSADELGFYPVSQQHRKLEAT